MTWLTNMAARVRGIWRQEHIRYGYPGLTRYLPEGLKLTREEQLSVSAAYGCVRAIIDPLAASDWEVFVRGEGGARTNQPDGTVFYVLNLRANRNLPAIAAKELILTHAATRGNGYGLILRDNAGHVVGWDILDPDRMATGWANDASVVGGGRIVYLYTLEDGTTWELPDTEIIHLRGPSVRDLFGGDSVLGRASIAVATAAAQEKFGNVYFANGAHLGGYLKLKGRLKSQADVDRLKADWNAKTAGIDKAGETAVLEDGAEFHDLTPDAERVQLVAPRAFQVEDIARFWGVPLVKLMVKEAATGYGANLSTLNEQFSRDTLTPWGKRTAQEFGYKLLPQRAPWPEIEVNLKWTTRGDAESRARVRQMDVQGGIITRDEARAEEGYSALPGGMGSLVTVTGATMLLKEAVRPKPPPPLLPVRAGEEDDDEAEEQRRRADDAEAERDAFKAKAAEIRGLLAEAEKNLGATAADLAAARKQIDERDAALAARAGDVEAARARIAALETEGAAARAAADELRAEAEELRAAATSAGEARDAAMAERDRDLADMRRFQASFIAADHARIAAERDRDEALARASEQAGALAAERSRAAGLEAELAAARDAIEAGRLAAASDLEAARTGAARAGEAAVAQARAEAETLRAEVAAARERGAAGEQRAAALERAGVLLALGNHARRWRARARDVAPEAAERAREDLRALFAADLGDFGRAVSAEQLGELAAQVEVGYEPAKAVAFIFDRRTA